MPTQNPLRTCISPGLISVSLRYYIYSNKRRGAYEIFRALSAAVNRGRRLFKNLTLQRNLFVKFNRISSFCTKQLQQLTEASFHCHNSPLSALYSGVSTQLISACPLLQHQFFGRKDIFSAVLDFLYIGFLSYTEFFK